MRFDHALGDEQAQAGAFLAVASATLGGPVRLEDVFELVRRDAGARVRDLEANRVAFAPRAQADVVSTRTELERVADQIREHLQYALAVAQHTRACELAFE